MCVCVWVRVHVRVCVCHMHVQSKALNILGRAYLKSWLNTHGQQLKPPK